MTVDFNDVVDVKQLLESINSSLYKLKNRIEEIAEEIDRVDDKLINLKDTSDDLASWVPSLAEFKKDAK